MTGKKRESRDRRISRVAGIRGGGSVWSVKGSGEVIYSIFFFF